MSYNQEYNETPEGHQQVFINSYPVPTAPIVPITHHILPCINEKYVYPPKQQMSRFTIEEYNRIYQIQHHKPRRQIIIVDEVDYLRRKQKRKTSFWKGFAALFCCLFCCCPIPC